MATCDEREEMLHINGKAIPVEIFLQIVECMDYEPGIIGKIMGTCKAFRDVLTSYEHSISQKIAKSLHPSSRSWKTIRSSSPKQSTFDQPTYPWLHELYIRSIAITQLTADPQLYPLLRLDHEDFPASARNNVRLQARILFMLYEFYDSEDKHAWIESEQRSREELAVMYVMVAIVCDNWRAFMYSKKSASRSLWMGVDRPQSAEERGLQMEEDCVYRELCLRHGPYFMQASIMENGVWFDEVMYEGKRELKRFEEGELEEHRGSLQGTILRRFCGMVGCEIMEGWLEMWLEIDSQCTKTKSS